MPTQTWVAKIRLRTGLQEVTVQANSFLIAKEMLEAQYGKGSVLSSPAPQRPTRNSEIKVQTETPSRRPRRPVGFHRHEQNDRLDESNVEEEIHEAGDDSFADEAVDHIAGIDLKYALFHAESQRSKWKKIGIIFLTTTIVLFLVLLFIVIGSAQP